MLVMALDGNSLAYRAFFALPEDMANASGQTTNAVYGFTTMLVNLIKEHRPDGVVVVFDRPEPTFRHEAIPEYKAQREKAPETLRSQLGVIRELLDLFGVTWLEMPGFEGDDLIATMADRAEREGRDILIVTGDRDSYQLVHDPHVRVLYNKRGVSDYAIYDEAGILERTGVTPAQYPDYAALRGDPSDNLDGIPGVGEKTAAKLVTQYGNLASVLAAADEQTPKLRANLHEHGERVTRNASMMVLRRDVPVDVDLGSLAPTPDMAGLRRLFDFLEFKTMAKRVDDLVKDRGWSVRGDTVAGTGGPPTAAAAVDVSVTIGDTRTLEPAEAAGLVSSCAELVMSARWEGDPGRSELVGISFVVDLPSGATGWMPLDVLKDKTVSRALASHGAVVAHDAKPIMRSLLSAGVDLQGLVLDTQIASYLVDPSRSSYSLASVCLDYIGTEPSASVESSGQFDFGGEEAAAIPRSCGEDAVLVGHLAKVMRQRLADIDNQSLYADIENPLVHVLARMEHLGIAVDRAALENIKVRLTAEAAELTARLYDVAGKQFNVNSTNQLREILYEDKGLTPGKKTKTGYSTDAATLEKLHDEWPEFIGPLLRYREVEKLRSTYGEGLLAEVAPDSRIHATFNQTVARTGRLSSDRPNLHNIPVRTDEGRVFRTAFVAREGCELMVADYNQIELRCIAHLADDPGLVTAFNAGEDIHRATAARVFGVDPSKVTHDQRSKAKMVSYGLAYGMEAYGLSQRLGIAVSEASGILDSYFAAFPNVKNYMESAVTEARNKQYTETLFKRRRPIPELLSDNFRIRQAGERQAMNAAIQGLAADIFKIALVRIDQRLRDQGLEARLVLQVHDEVIVESPTAEHDAVNDVVLDAMKGAADLRVPLEVNAAWGPTWAEAKA
ncbi:MAG: polymerase [Actinomycetota bacterium]|jgi:DNA polymerase-1